MLSLASMSRIRGGTASCAGLPAMLEVPPEVFRPCRSGRLGCQSLRAARRAELQAALVALSANVNETLSAQKFTEQGEKVAQ